MTAKLLHRHTLVRRRMPLSAVSCTKLASSMPSPASARAKRMASAVYSCTAWASVLKLPACDPTGKLAAAP